MGCWLKPPPKVTFVANPLQSGDMSGKHSTQIFTFNLQNGKTIRCKWCRLRIKSQCDAQRNLTLWISKPPPKNWDLRLFDAWKKFQTYSPNGGAKWWWIPWYKVKKLTWKTNNRNTRANTFFLEAKSWTLSVGYRWNKIHDQLKSAGDQSFRHIFSQPFGKQHFSINQIHFRIR